MDRTLVLFFALFTQVHALNRLAHGEQTALTKDASPFYKSECWKQRPVGSFIQAPGAGLATFEPFGTVLKDGFYNVACVKDYMYSFGDKFGDGKFAYKVGDLSNVSIVDYDLHVLKEDRQTMTPTVCFEFCRTVPDMTFFGITNGRTCYCTPYYKAMESDSTQCDVVCDGDNTQMCGGKVKSDIYEMHMCSSTQADLTKAAGKASDFVAKMEDLVLNATKASEDMQKSASRLKDLFGQAGDPSAADLMVKAMQFAGELDHAAEAVTAVVEDIKAKVSEAEQPVADSSDSVTKSERIMEAMEKGMIKGDGLMEELSRLYMLAHPAVAKVNQSEQFYPAMYFVNKKFAKVPQTCTGEPVGEPIVNLDLDGCSYACNTEVEDCVGFSFFDAPTPLCFLFSKLEKLQYYTGCDAGPSFLQRRDAIFDSYCMAKFAKFDGTTLKPDPSKKCELCLEEASKADRCY